MKPMIRALILFTLISLPLKGEITEFKALMGGDTPHWIHLSRPDEIDFLFHLEQIYEAHKERRFSEDKPRIPLVAHFIWLGPKPFPPKSVENIRSWIAHHPDWKMVLWTDRERLAPCKGMEVKQVQEFPFLFLRHCFIESTNWSEKADILTFELLYQEGGMVIHHDVHCQRPFDSLNRGYDFYCGLDVPHPPVGGKNITSETGLLAARPFHPVVGKTIELIGRDWDVLSRKYRGLDRESRNLLIHERTFLALTEALKVRLCEDGNIDVAFPAAYFSGRSGLPTLYAQHQRSQTWADTPEKREAVKHSSPRIKWIRWIGRGALSLNMLAGAGLFVYFRVRRKKQE